MNNNNGLYFLVGGLCVVVVVFLLFGGHGHFGHVWHRGGETTTVEHHIPGGGSETVTRTDRP